MVEVLMIKKVLMKAIIFLIMSNMLLMLLRQI